MLEKIGAASAKKICDEVPAAMELIISNTIDEMEKDIANQEVFKFKFLNKIVQGLYSLHSASCLEDYKFKFLDKVV